MQVEKRTNELDVCECGSKPDHFGIGYGPTPYSVMCPGCKKSTNRYRSIGGQAQNIIDFWNEIAPLKETSVWMDPNSKLKYRICGKEYEYRDVRRAILAQWEKKKYKFKIYIHFENGKVTCEHKQFLEKRDYEYWY